MLKLGRKDNNEKYSADEAKSISLESIKKMIEAELPGAFAKKVPAKKTAAKKAPAKKKTK